MASSARSNLLQAAAYAAASALFFALMSGAVKLASNEVPNATIVLFRNGVALALLLPFLLRAGLDGVRTNHVRGHVVRGLAGLASMACFFYAIVHLGLAQAVLLNQSAPLFLPIVGYLWLRERAPRRIWWSLALGFAGIVLIVRPGSNFFFLAAGAGILSAVFAAVAHVGVRALTATEPPARIVCYFALIGTIASAPVAAFGWRSPNGNTLLALVVVGVLGTLGQLALTRAYAKASAASVGPFIYTGPVFAGLIDWSIWKVVPDRLFVLGAALVVLAAIATLRAGNDPETAVR